MRQTCGGGASLLVAGFSCLHVLQPGPKLLVSATRELSRSGAGQLMQGALPDRCHLSSVIVKMILVSYKIGVHSG